MLLNIIGTFTLMCLAINALAVGYAFQHGFTNVVGMGVCAIVINIGFLKLIDYAKKNLINE